MADVNFSVSLELAKGNLFSSFSRSGTTDIATAGILLQTLTAGTTPTQITTTTIGTLGLAFAQSLVTTTQATCTITFGRLVSGTMHDSTTMRPNEFFLGRLAPGNYAIKAAAEGYRVQVAIVED
jgi:hypothetical protein